LKFFQWVKNLLWIATCTLEPDGYKSFQWVKNLLWIATKWTARTCQNGRESFQWVKNLLWIATLQRL